MKPSTPLWLTLGLVLTSVACKSSPNNTNAAGSAGAGHTIISAGGDNPVDQGNSTGGSDSEGGSKGSDGSDSAGASVGTEDGSTSDGGSGVAAFTDCAGLAEQACARLDECAPFLTEAHYGDVSTCKTQLSAICSGLDASETPVDFARCAQSLASCGSFVESVGVPAWCWKPRGASAVGEVCIVDTDCKDGLCQRAKGDAAGMCGKPANEGTSCASPTRCALGLRCSPVDSVCRKPVGVGKSCDGPMDCQSGLKCTAEHVCTRTAVDDPCDEAISLCNRGAGQICVMGQCLAEVWADGSCFKGNEECRGTTRCVVKQTSGLQREASCLATVGLDEACDSTKPCLEPLTCTKGLCRP